jgi:starch synthase (maltosyl-transferring)
MIFIIHYLNKNGKNRVVIEHIQPEIDGGYFPIKRIIGEKVKVTADIFADGHDQVRADLLF